MGSIDINHLAMKVLDAINEHITVIDPQGHIVFVNNAWCQFAKCNNGNSSLKDWIGINYIDICIKAAEQGDEISNNAYDGIINVISSKQDFYMEYPCHSPDIERWFMMRVSPLKIHSDYFYVITHQDITQRKLAENTAIKNAQIDGLTKIFNRSTGDDFSSNEFRRCQRLKLPITIAFIDVDNFKMINDKYGHTIGDECLKSIAKIIKQYCKRPSDCSYRYGGDEFSIVWGNLLINDAIKLSNAILNEVSKIHYLKGKLLDVPISLSIGLGCAILLPSNQMSNDLITLADNAMYNAKENGKNRVEYLLLDDKKTLTNTQLNLIEKKPLKQ